MSKARKIDPQEQARILSEALPHMQRYDEEIVVVKYGGHAMGQEQTARDFARDIVLLEQTAINPVVVHGGGPQIEAMLKQLGIESSDFREEWQPLFGRGSTPCSEDNKYPAKDELWDAFQRLQKAAMEKVLTLTPEQLAQPHSIESLKEPFPTIGDLLLQMLTAHDGLHVGQLSDWRRTLGFPRLM